MPDEDPAAERDLTMRLERLERVLGLQTLAADESTGDLLAGQSTQSINCNSVRSCASVICAVGEEPVLRRA